MSGKINFAGLKIDRALPEPLYLQLAAGLRRQLDADGADGAGELPSVRELARGAGVDRSTATKAYAELRRTGVAELCSPRKLRVAADLRRNLHPFPNLAVVIPRRFSDYIEQDGGMPMRYISGIIDAAAERNISTLMLQLPPPDAARGTIERFLDEIVVRLEGVIHLGGRYDDSNDFSLRRLFGDRRISQVTIACSTDEEQIGTVCSDPESGGRALAEALRTLGHRKVALCSSYGNLERAAQLVRYEVFDRVRRMARVFQNYKFESSVLLGLDCYQAVYQRVSRLLREHRMPTAFWCQNDGMAARFVAALERHNLRVPEDVSVVGYDGVPPPGFADRLTTLSLPFYAIGREAVKMLLEIKESVCTDLRREVPTSLVMRQTLGSAKNMNQ